MKFESFQHSVTLMKLKLRLHDYAHNTRREMLFVTIIYKLYIALDAGKDRKSRRRSGKVKFGNLQVITLSKLKLWPRHSAVNVLCKIPF